MPEPHRSTILELGARGEYDNPDYLAAVDVFYHLHLCRMDPWPDAMRKGEKTSSTRPYQVMNGPTEFDVIGRLATWDRTADLGAIDVPTLITVGRYDEITPACAETIHEGVRNSRVVALREQRTYRASRGGRALCGGRRGVPELGVEQLRVAGRQLVVRVQSAWIGQHPHIGARDALVPGDRLTPWADQTRSGRSTHRGRRPCAGGSARSWRSAHGRPRGARPGVSSAAAAVVRGTRLTMPMP